MTPRSHLAASMKTKRGYHKRRSLSMTQLTPPSMPLAKTEEGSSRLEAEGNVLEPLDCPIAAIDDIDTEMAESLTVSKRPLGNRHRRRSSSQRRSSFMGSGMRKERIQFHETGYLDSEGQTTYVLRVTEAQGFRWNPLIHELQDETTFFDDVY